MTDRLIHLAQTLAKLVACIALGVMFQHLQGNAGLGILPGSQGLLILGLLGGCLIVHDERDQGEHYGIDVLERARVGNSDGLGLMHPQPSGEELVIWKDLNDLDQLHNRYTTARDAGVPVTLHFRAISAGDGSLENCHPFRIGDQPLGVAHNGTITAYTGWLDNDWVEDGMSDTRFFVQHVLEKFPEGFMYNPVLLHAIEQIVGGDRMVLMNAEGERAIINEQRGSWEEDDRVWFSHTAGIYRVINGKTSSQRSSVSSSKGFGRRGEQWGRGFDGTLNSQEYCMRCHRRGHESDNCPLVMSQTGTSSGGCSASSGSDDDTTEWSESKPCAYCLGEFSHRATEVCPQSTTPDGKCVFCGDFGGHTAIALDVSCDVEIPDEDDKEFLEALAKGGLPGSDQRPCAYCGHHVEDGDAIHVQHSAGEGLKDLWIFHKGCEDKTVWCHECAKPIREWQMMFEDEDHRVYHAMPGVCSAVEVESGYLRYWYPKGAERKDQRQFTCLSLKAKTGITLPVTNQGLYYKQEPVCFECLTQVSEGDWQHHDATQLPLPAPDTGLECAWCSEDLT